MKHETLILFTCEACGYRARVPRAFDGAAILCPSCTSSQVVTAKPETGPRSGDTQVIKAPEPAPAAATPPQAPATPPPTALPPAAPPAAAPAPTVAPASIAPTEKLQLGKIAFECTKCHAKARIPSEYAGKVVRCPSCDAVQIALGGAAPATGRMVKGQATVFATAKLDGNGKIIFTCTACNYSARLAQGYAGKAIQCPSCKAAQMVGILPLGATPEAAKSGTSTIVSTVTQAVRRGDLQAPVPPAEKAGTSPLGNPVIGSGSRPSVAPTSPAKASTSPLGNPVIGSTPRPASAVPQPAKMPTPPTVPPPSPQPTTASTARPAEDRPRIGESTDLFMAANPDPGSKTSGRVVRRGKTERITTPEPAVPKPTPATAATQRTPLPTAPAQPNVAAKPAPQAKPPSGVKPASELVKAPATAEPAPPPARSGSGNWMFLVVVVVAVVVLAAAAVYVLNNKAEEEAKARIQAAQELQIKAESEKRAAEKAREQKNKELEEQQKKADEAVIAKARAEKSLEEERKKAEEANAAKAQAEAAKAQAEAKAAEIQKMLTDLTQQVDELRRKLDAQLKPEAKSKDVGKPKDAKAAEVKAPDAKPAEAKPAP